MKEKLSAAKFVAGYNPLGFLKAFSIMSKIAIIIGLGYAIYITAIKPNFNPLRTVEQNADQIINNDIKAPKRHHIELLWGVIRLW